MKNLSKEIENTLISVIRPYSKDFKVFDKETMQRITGEELTVSEATEKLLSLISKSSDYLIGEDEENKFEGITTQTSDQYGANRLRSEQRARKKDLLND